MKPKLMTPDAIYKRKEMAALTANPEAHAEYLAKEPERKRNKPASMTAGSSPYSKGRLPGRQFHGRRSPAASSSAVARRVRAPENHHRHSPAPSSRAVAHRAVRTPVNNRPTFGQQMEVLSSLQNFSLKLAGTVAGNVTASSNLVITGCNQMPRDCVEDYALEEEEGDYELEEEEEDYELEEEEEDYELEDEEEDFELEEEEEFAKTPEEDDIKDARNMEVLLSVERTAIKMSKIISKNLMSGVTSVAKSIIAGNNRTSENGNAPASEHGSPFTSGKDCHQDVQDHFQKSYERGNKRG